MLDSSPLLLDRVAVKEGGKTKYVSIPASDEKRPSKSASYLL